MTYQPKSEGKVADFEPFTLCISLKSKSNVYLFLQGICYGVLVVPGKNSIANHCLFSD